MKKIIFCLATLLSTAVNSQTISCGMWADGTTPFQFVRVNMTNGTTVFNNPLPALTSTVFETAFVNPLTGEYVIKANMPYQYYTIDIATGTVVNSAPAPDEVLAMRINPADGTVYGLLFNGTDFDFVSVNTTTGVVTNIATLDDVNGFNMGSAAFDATNNRYFFIGSYSTDAPGIFRCFLVDATTGSITHDTVAPENLQELQLHPDNSLLYGLWSNGTDFEFVSVDPQTGIQSSVNTLAGIDAVTSETAVLNDAANQYVFKGVNGAINYYYSVDISTGNIVADAAEADEILHLRFYGDAAALSIPELSEGITCSLFPNPAGSVVELRSSLPLDNATIVLYNATGDVVCSDHFTGQAYELNRNSLPSGLYLLHVIENGTVRFSHKVSWVD